MLKKKLTSFLNQGDLIEVIATAFPDNKYTTDVRNQKITQLGKNIKVEFIIPDNLFSSNNDHFFANDIDVMQQNLCASITNNKSKILWAYRGGYGTANLLPALSSIKKPENSKLLIGYSDVTALSIYLNLVWNWKTIHYHMLSHIIDETSAINNQEHFALLKKILFNEITSLKYKILPVNDNAKNITSNIEAIITGGNLSVIQTLIGTSYQPNLEDKILVLEDIGEEGYKVDRMLVHLSQAGLFNGIKAVIFGDFICNNKLHSKSCETAINRFANNAEFPVYRIKNIGHLDDSLPIVFGTNSVISLNSLEVYI
jgi:muramoyltetrapeptide carboxypeptidase